MVGPDFSPEPRTGPVPLSVPLDYPEPRRRVPGWAWAAGVVVLLIGLALVISLTTSASNDIFGGPVRHTSDDVLEQAIQDQLSALGADDARKIAHHAGCGLFEAMRDQTQELALARMSGQGFIKDYGKATVTSVDKVVWLSDRQVHVLYSMKTAKGTDTNPQGQAELLIDGKDIYVCSNYLRTQPSV